MEGRSQKLQERDWQQEETKQKPKLECICSGSSDVHEFKHKVPLLYSSFFPSCVCTHAQGYTYRHTNILRQKIYAHQQLLYAYMQLVVV